MIKLKNTPEQIELVKAIGSKDPATSRLAQEAFASAIGPVLQIVLEQAGTASLIYVDQPFQEDESPSYPLDLYYNEGVGFIQVWSQTIAGGLPTNDVRGNAEMKIATYTLNSAVSFLKKYARKSNLNVLAKAVERMLQEVLLKQERTAWSVIMAALGQAVSTVNGVATTHTIPAQNLGIFQMEDLNQMMTKMKRINASFAGGTAITPYSKGITDLFVSPEVKAQIRAFAYQPMNTRPGPTVAGSTLSAYTATTAVPLPDAVREAIFNGAGTQEIYGVQITELNELGKNQKYDLLFSQYATGNIAPNITAANLGPYVYGTDEVVVGLDLSRDAFIRAVATDSDNSSTFSVIPDDQFFLRQEKVGFWGAVEEGRVCIDARAVIGLIL